MSYPLEKYTYYFTGNKVIAVSTYAGKAVRGVAKCDPRDEFSVKDGKKLAAARCNDRIARKRAARAHAELQKADRALKDAKAHAEKMAEYYADATDRKAEAANELADILKEMGA